jgi:hypothetical protein
VPPATPGWGTKWKQALRDNYLSTINAGDGAHGSGRANLRRRMFRLPQAGW